MELFDVILYMAGLIALLVIVLVPLNSWHSNLTPAQRAELDKDDDTHVW
jgi:hypothetical protein